MKIISSSAVHGGVSVPTLKSRHLGTNAERAHVTVPLPCAPASSLRGYIDVSGVGGVLGGQSHDNQDELLHISYSA